VLELLRPRSLQVDEIALSVAKGCDHTLGRAGVDRDDVVEFEPALEASVLEHRERLAAVIDKHALSAELVPAEPAVGVAREQKEAVHFVDLREMHRRRRLALLERRKALGGRGLNDMHGTVEETRNGRRAGRGDAVAGSEPLALEEAAGEGGDERRIERRKACELDADFFAQRCLLGCGTASTRAPWPARGGRNPR
jgi:hypothetical protein